MHILYDFQIFGQQYGGVSRYYYELARRISQYDGVRLSVLALLYANKYLQNSDLHGLIGYHVRSLPKTARLRRLVNKTLTHLYLKRLQPDIMHETFYYLEKYPSTSFKKVTTIHDMIHEKFPAYFFRNNRIAALKKNAAERADHIICVSQHTKNDLCGLHRIHPGKVSVVYHGSPFEGAIRTCEPPVIDVPYLLYVGTRDIYKNFMRFLSAYATSPRLHSDFHLVSFGSGMFTKAEMDVIQSLQLRPDRIIHLSGDDTLLANLYAHAALLVYPSLYEGFGFPLLEAMSLNCPIACSNTSSLPEIADDAAAFFDPCDIDNMRQVIEEVVYSSTLTKELIAKGKQRIRLFSWERSAAETYNIYKRLVN